MPHALFQLSLTTQGAWALAAVAALVGLTFWLGGARFNRSVATLAGVLIGGVGGMEMPRLLGWSISGMAPAVAAAMTLGLIGFLLHRAWIGIALGLLLALLGSIVVWHTLGPPADWAWPAMNAGRRQWLIDIWTQLPSNTRHAIMAVSGATLFSGIAIGMLWPRVAMVLMYSLAGVSLLSGLYFGPLVGGISRPQWLVDHGGAQEAIFILLVLTGAALQWRLTKPAVAVSGPARDDWDEDD
jgi:hypothetical protein